MKEEEEEEIEVEEENIEEEEEEKEVQEEEIEEEEEVIEVVNIDQEPELLYIKMKVSLIFIIILKINVIRSVFIYFFWKNTIYKRTNTNSLSLIK